MLAAQTALAPVVDDDGRVVGLLSIELLSHVLGSEA